jgi:hypothetical protein
MVVPEMMKASFVRADGNGIYVAYTDVDYAVEEFYDWDVLKGWGYDGTMASIAGEIARRAEVRTLDQNARANQVSPGAPVDGEGWTHEG